MQLFKAIIQLRNTLVQLYQETQDNLLKEYMCKEITKTALLQIVNRDNTETEHSRKRMSNQSCWGKLYRNDCVLCVNDCELCLKDEQKFSRHRKESKAEDAQKRYSLSQEQEGLPCTQNVVRLREERGFWEMRAENKADLRNSRIYTY